MANHNSGSKTSERISAQPVYDTLRFVQEIALADRGANEPDAERCTDQPSRS
jgi:hypothetical protein